MQNNIYLLQYYMGIASLGLGFENMQRSILALCRRNTVCGSKLFIAHRVTENRFRHQFAVYYKEINIIRGIFIWTS